MAIYNLRGEPALFDLDAWQARLAELRGDDPSEFRGTLIEHAEAHIRAIGGNPQKTAQEAT